jgi:hypothetical protein
VVVCRDDFAPVADASTDDGALLSDVPSPVHGVQLVSMPVPVANVLVVVDGTSVGTRTDDGGRFSLVGVPAAVPLAISALLGPGAPAGARVGVLVGPGETVDIGMLVMGEAGGSVCAPKSPDPLDRAAEPSSLGRLY